VPGVTSVAIIGTGVGGLAAAVWLEHAGVDDLVVFEKSGDVSYGGGPATDRRASLTEPMSP
jgi:cation diffusion facilitator CzcD-associated flavoprotein CzcO